MSYIMSMQLGKIGLSPKLFRKKFSQVNLSKRFNPNGKQVKVNLFRKKNNQKGISPLIAAVLLIAFTMTIAGLMAAWATQYVSGQTEQLTEQSEETQECSGANFNIEEALKGTSDVILSVFNSGDVDFDDLDVVMIYSNATDVISQTVSNALNKTFPKGQYWTFKVPINTSVNLSLTKIRVVTTNCRKVYKEKTFS